MENLDIEKIVPIFQKAMVGDREAVARLTLQPMAGDASTRRYFRIHTGSRSLVVMLLPEDIHKSDEITKDGPQNELPFLQVARFLAKGGIRVPDVVLSQVRDRVIILEDVGDDTIERLLQQGANKQALYKAAIRQMVKIHKWAHEHPEPSCICFNRAFDWDLLMWECHHFTQWGMEALTGRALTGKEQKVLDLAFETIVRHLTAVPQGFVHRDFQSRNLMLHDQELVVIDFQDALIGPYIYDITALLRDSYVYFNPRETEFYLDYFYDLRKDAGLETESKEAFLKTFHFQTIQRKLKDAGRFVFIDRQKGNPKFLPNIPRSLNYAVSSMSMFSEFDEARALITDWLAEFMQGEP